MVVFLAATEMKEPGSFPSRIGGERFTLEAPMHPDAGYVRQLLQEAKPSSLMKQRFSIGTALGLSL